MLRLSAAVTALLFAALAFSPFITSATIGDGPSACSAGKHMSTAEDVAKGLPANTCVDDSISSYLNGGCGSNPYDMLQSGGYIGGGQVRPVSSGGSSDAALRQGIDPALACRLFKFFEATKAKGCTVKIISAYRSAQQQESMCGTGRSGCAAPGKSCHQYGLAVDVQTSCIGWMRAAAPQFQLVFPYYGQHIQCAEHPVAACSLSTKACNGGVKITPDLSRIPNPSQVPDTYFQPPSTQPQNPFQNPNTPFMSNQPVPPPAYNPQSTVPPGTSYQDMDHPVETPIPNTPVATTTPPFTVKAATSTKVIQGPNAADKIGTLAGGEDTSGGEQNSPTGSSSPTKLNGDLNDVGSTNTGGTNISDDIADGTLAINSVAVNPILVTETFSGREPTIVQQPVSSSTANKTLIVALLTTLRDLLVSFLHALTTRSTYGFQGAWHPATLGPISR